VTGFAILLSMIIFFPESTVLVNLAAVLIILPLIISLVVSYYVYDASELYSLKWLSELSIVPESRIVNIHAGFDETSSLLKARYPDSELSVFDFYDPQKHTEVSIARARKAYVAFPQTLRIDTRSIPLPKGSADSIFNIFSLHEIRNTAERISFLKSQHAVLSENGYCIVAEHLRDLPNFLAYNIGFFHFHAAREWKSNFTAAGFELLLEKKITPFVSIFVLRKTHGVTP
jgi:hypothetical protein